MSHIVSIQTQLKDAAAVTAACRRLGLAEPVLGTARLYSGEATGLIVNLPGWKYPAVIDTVTGDLKYDNYEGRWGDSGRLDQFLQIYAVELAKGEARRRGHQVAEQSLANGTIKLTITEAN